MRPIRLDDVSTSESNPSAITASDPELRPTASLTAVIPRLHNTTIKRTRRKALPRVDDIMRHVFYTVRRRGGRMPVAKKGQGGQITTWPPCPFSQVTRLLVHRH